MTNYQNLMDPQLIPNFVEEILRLESPAQGMFREVRKNTCLDGVDLKAGDILNRFGSANRDEKKFSDFELIEIDKPIKYTPSFFGRNPE